MFFFVRKYINIKTKAFEKTPLFYSVSAGIIMAIVLSVFYFIYNYNSTDYEIINQIKENDPYIIIVYVYLEVLLLSINGSKDSELIHMFKDSIHDNTIDKHDILYILRNNKELCKHVINRLIDLYPDHLNKYYTNIPYQIIVKYRNQRSK